MSLGNPQEIGEAVLELGLIKPDDWAAVWPSIADKDANTAFDILQSRGLLTGLQLAGQQRVADARALRSGFAQYDHPELRPLAERCLVFGRGVAPPMAPNGAYNNIDEKGLWKNIRFDLSQPDFVDEANGEFDPSEVREIGIQFDTSSTTTTAQPGAWLIDNIAY